MPANGEHAKTEQVMGRQINIFLILFSFLFPEIFYNGYAAICGAKTFLFVSESFYQCFAVKVDAFFIEPIDDGIEGGRIMSIQYSWVNFIKWAQS